MLDTFVADFLRLALADDRGAEVAARLSNPEQEALHDAVARLHRFLQVDDFSGSLVAPLLRAQLEVDELPLDDGTRIERFTDQLRRQLWSSHGWGSLSLSPLPAEEVLSAEQVISIDVAGKQLGGWDWWKALQQVLRVLLALRLTAPGSVAAPWFMLRPQSEFSDYLVSSV